MIITGTVVAIDMNATMKKKGGGTYDGVELTFKDGNGKTQTKGFHSKTFDFNKELKSELSSLSVKDEFTAELEKDGDFWNWKKVTKGAAPKAEDTGTKYVKKENNYPTTDERAKTQEYIVKQSSITAALKLLELSKQEVNDDIVLKKADMFFNYVMGNNNSDDFPL